MSPTLLALLVLAPARATTPGGWRVQAAVPETSIALRPVAVLGDPVGDVTQVTADLRVGFRNVALDAEIPWIHAEGAYGDWSSSDVGNLRVGAYGWFFHQHFQAGAEIATPLTAAEDAPRSWGSLSREALPDGELLVVFQTLWATERLNVTTRGAVGLPWGPYISWLLGSSLRTPIVEAAVAFTVAIRGPIGFVGEAEFLVDRVPLSTRLLLRADVPAGRGWLAFDLGLQIPIYEELGALEDPDAHPTFQPIAQVRWYPVLDWPSAH